MPYNLTLTGATFANGALTEGYGTVPFSPMISGLPITLAAKVKTSETSGTLIAFGTIGSPGFWFGVKDGSVRAEINGTPIGSGYPAHGISDGAEYTIELVITATYARFYRNGVYVNGTTGSFGLDLVTNPLGVGTFAGANQYAWNTDEVSSIRECAVWNIAKYTDTSTHTVPETIDHFDTGLVALWHLETDGNDSAGVILAGDSVDIEPEDPAIFYSPFTWNKVNGTYTTICSGAYFRVKFSGQACVLKFDISTIEDPNPQIWYRLDGITAWTAVPIAATVTLTIPALINTIPKHVLEVMVKSTSEQLERWSTLETAIKFQGLTIAPDCEVFVTENNNPVNILFFSDSIGEGVRTISMSGGQTANNDAKSSWTYHVARILGAEFGNVGFGGQGWNNGGGGSVPKLSASYDLNYAGSARVFTPYPRVVVVMMGTNDSGNVTTEVTTFLNGILVDIPSPCKITILRPFNGTARAAELQAGIAACSDPTRVVYIDTAGFWDDEDSVDGLHPYGYTNMADIAPKVAEAIREYVYPEAAVEPGEATAEIFFKKMY